MANEYPLKMMVDGLENLAADNQRLCEFLNLRAKFYGFDAKFKGAEFRPPQPKYPDKKESQATAADLVTKIADNNAFAVLSLSGKPSAPGALDSKKYDEADLLRLMIDWGTLQSGVYKTILQLYGERPTPPPELPSPGPASENRLWREIVAWLEKIAADTDLYNMVQNIIPKRGSKTKAADPDPDPLIRMERGVHRVTLDILQIAGLLPYHLYHAAHSGGPPASK
jgi:hypothetical protein